MVKWKLYITMLVSLPFLGLYFFVIGFPVGGWVTGVCLLVLLLLDLFHAARRPCPVCGARVFHSTRIHMRETDGE
jgi:hypothetical protein